MQENLKTMMIFVMGLASKLYSYRVNLRICAILNVLYTMWIRNFISQVGSRTVFAKKFTIVGGDFVAIGERNSFAEGCMVSAWKEYGGYKYNPQITIGNDCNFGKMNHITCCNKITIGNGVLTGMYVLISDNSHGEINAEALSIPPIGTSIS